MPRSTAQKKLRLLSIPVVVVLVLAGTWVTGALLTDDATLAMAATAGWFALAGLLAALVARTHRRLALPVLSSWALTVAVVGGALLWTSTVDTTVEETVLTASEPVSAPGGPTTAPEVATSPTAGAAPATGAGAASAAPSETTATKPAVRSLGAGDFVADAHPTTGRATLLEKPDGRRVVTLTKLATDPGPDLRVYLVPEGAEVEDGVDLGRLKGNKGTQQYSVPEGRAAAGSVVIWCRAFSVSFGTALLA